MTDYTPFLIAAALVAVVVIFQFSQASATKPAAPAAPVPVLDPKEFRSFPLIKKTEVSHNTTIYRFGLPSETDVLGLPVGQHISVRAIIQEREVLRSYTPVAHAPGHFDLLVKAYPNGNISKYLTTVKVGDHVEFRGPKGAFNYTPGLVKHFNMIAGGTGITPMLQIIQAIVDNPEDKTTVDLVFGNVNEDDILLRAELETLAKDPRVKVHHVLNNPPEEWNGSTGFITKEILKKETTGPSPDSKFLICGPPPMVKAIKDAALELGWEKARALSKLEDQVFAF